MGLRLPLPALCSFMGLLQLALALSSGSHSSTQTYNIPGEVQNTTSHAQFTASAAGPDAPKIHPVNASVFDWWYFDVVSTDPTSLASVVVVLYTTTPEAFPRGEPSGPVVASISGSFSNGTLFSATTEGESATVTTGHDASSAGVWHNTGFSWSSPRPSEYSITIDAPQIGVKGTIQFKSTAPGHYPCGPIAVGQDMQVAPHIGWANAVPDSVATVRLIVGGTKLSFSGAGYHDKNWSDQLFTANVDSWYWGHGRVGPYSVVWFDFLGLDGLEYVSAYAAKAGKIVVASCGAKSIRVRPVGRNSTYPPTISSKRPDGYHITLGLPGDGVLEMDVAVAAPIVVGVPIYARSVGRTSGFITCAGEGTKSLAAGVALFEQFTMTP
ncbi:hypothetical protein C8J57DRAFT_1181335 [Mycena rebaudengoi]|nr:hypothetical protein C8J57DRAFT_1181335 [Mycena rebaudengoi]